MKSYPVIIIITQLLPYLFPGGLVAQISPIALHPENPHYFLYRNKPTILVTSAEHYGAVINLDFDYITYLDELQSKRLNLTRTFTGVYVEPPGAFNITKNSVISIGCCVCADQSRRLLSFVCNVWNEYLPCKKYY